MDAGAAQIELFILGQQLGARETSERLQFLIGLFSRRSTKMRCKCGQSRVRMLWQSEGFPHWRRDSLDLYSAEGIRVFLCMRHQGVAGRLILSERINRLYQLFPDLDTVQKCSEVLVSVSSKHLNTETMFAYP